MYACPDVCKFSSLPRAMSTPSELILFISCITEVSFPGMTLAEYSSRSDGSNFSKGLASCEANDRAALGSPCKRQSNPKSSQNQYVARVNMSQQQEVQIVTRLATYQKAIQNVVGSSFPVYSSAQSPS